MNKYYIILKYIILGGLLILLTEGCGAKDDRLNINNPTEDGIYYLILDKSLLNRSDDLLKNCKMFTYHNYLNSIPPYTKESRLIERSDGWIDYIETGENKKLYVFSFDTDTLEKYEWEKIIHKNKYKKRYSFSLEELNKRNWIVDLD